VSDHRNDVQRMRTVFAEALSLAGKSGEVEALRIRFLGKKGELTAALKSLGKLPSEERPSAGASWNALRVEMEESLDKAMTSTLLAEAEEAERRQSVDVTQPGCGRPYGAFHPVVQVMHDVVDIFVGLGFSVASGPEIEDDFHNFEALNIPPHHPARDMQDTFYLRQGGLLLRTHTSPVQVRSMLRYGAPLRVVCPGRVYRRDSDPTHSPMFHQLEGLLVEENVSIADIKGCLEVFVNRIFGRPLKARYRSSFFPFTEPSMEMDVECVACSGDDPNCRICKGTGWLEVMGLGMIHPNVLRSGRIDPERYNGFAWGMGLDRIAMLKYGLDDLRVLFQGDAAFLSSGGVR
jgi:phenylalanyl-tRNA synthetase alpha chain